MNIVFDGEFYRCVNITGPTHNYLALQLISESLLEEPLVFDKDKEINSRNLPNVSSDNVKTQVISALVELRSALALKIGIKKIEYCSSDTPSQNVYYEMTKKIIEYYNAALL